MALQANVYIEVHVLQAGEIIYCRQNVRFKLQLPF
jgi:hypothetical protein